MQSVTVEPGTTTASVTCHLATGNTCRGCRVQWRDGNGEGGEAVAYKMGQNSLTASTTINSLVPGHTYNLVACDVESNGSLSDVKVEHLFETKRKCLLYRGILAKFISALHMNVVMWLSFMVQPVCTQVTLHGHMNLLH